jgi:hypothetical protein
MVLTSFGIDTFSARRGKRKQAPVNLAPYFTSRASLLSIPFDIANIQLDITGFQKKNPIFWGIFLANGWEK